MIRYLIILLSLNFFMLMCNAQSFVERYSKLTSQNLPAFFIEWENYSDSVSAKNKINDSVLEKIIEHEISLIKLNNENDSIGPLPKYYVVPQYIEV